MIRHLFRASLAATLVLAIAPPASAQEAGLVPRWEIDLGSWFSTTSTEVRADSDQFGLGTQFDVEETLGLDDGQTLPRVSIAARLGRRHQLRLRYSDYSVEGRREAPFELRVRNIVIPVNAVIDTQWDFTFYDVTYSYYFSLSDSTAWSFSLGAANWDFDIDLKARDDRLNRELQEDIDIDEWVPEVGLGLRQRLSRKLHFRAGVSGLQAEVDEEEATILNANLRFDYRALKNIGVGVAFSHTQVEYKNGGGSFLGIYDYEISGVQVFVPIYFD